MKTQQQSPLPAASDGLVPENAPDCTDSALHIRDVSSESSGPGDPACPPGALLLQQPLTDWQQKAVKPNVRRVQRDLGIPSPPLSDSDTLLDVLSLRADKLATQPAFSDLSVSSTVSDMCVVERSLTLTFSAFLYQSIAFSQRLTALGVKPGDSVLIADSGISVASSGVC